jgi:hypothetical protein
MALPLHVLPRAAYAVGMIRRDVGHEYWLFEQHDHALLAGDMARKVGGQFLTFEPLAASIAAVDLHDCGWPVHDQAPTLNPKGQPLDVFETPRHIGLPIWEASARQAAEHDPYTGLLVSLHSLSLSVLAASHASSKQKHEQFNLEDARTRFEINRFQHGQTELQEQLRKQLQLSTGIPMRMGLAETANNLREQQLVHNFRLLQAMDQLSLSICCTEPPGSQTSPVHYRPGGSSVSLDVHRPSDKLLVVDPWPFAVAEVRVSIKYRRLAAQSFADDDAFGAAYAKAPQSVLECAVVPQAYIAPDEHPLSL